MAITLTRDWTDWSNGFDKPSVKVPTGSVLHAGRVLGLGVDRSVRIMSDVWADLGFAEYWDDATGSIRHFPTFNSEFPGGEPVVTIDADATTYEKAFSWLVEKEYAKELADLDARASRAADDANRVAKGKRVEVTAGRKVPKGTMGEVFWVGDTAYGTRVGFKGDDGVTYWTAKTNVTVLDGWDWFDAEPFLLTDARKARLRKLAVDAAVKHAAANKWISDAAAAAYAAAA